MPSLFRSTMTVSLYTALSRVSGFIRDVLIASFLGTGIRADAFYVAFRLPNLVRAILTEGAFNAAFIPLFSKDMRNHGIQHALRSAGYILTFLTTLLVIAVALIELAAPVVLTWIAPGLAKTPGRLEYATVFTRIMFPFVIFASISAIFIGILNSLQKFTMGAVSPIILNIGMIIALLVSPQHLAGHALAVSVLVSGILQFSILWWELRRKNILILPKIITINQPVRHFFRLMIPSILSSGTVQINLMIALSFLSFLPVGAISYFFYAGRLAHLPVGLIGMTISTVLLPVLSGHHSAKKLDNALNLQRKALEYTFFLIIPATVGLYILSKPIVSVLFQRGAFDAHASYQTAQVLSIFVLGLPADILCKVLSTVFFAQEDTKTPLYGALLSMITSFILCYILFESFGHTGVASASAAGSWCNATWLVVNLFRQHQLACDKLLLWRITLFGACSTIMGITIVILNNLLGHIIYTNGIMAWLSLGMMIGVAIIVYLFLNCLIGYLDIKQAIDITKRFLGRTNCL